MATTNATTTTTTPATATISSDLCKKIVSNHPGWDNRRIPNDTADAIGHVLRLFIVEARARASIEVSSMYVFW